MKNFDEKIIDTLEKHKNALRLSESEKSEMKDGLLDLIKEFPVSNFNPARQGKVEELGLVSRTLSLFKLSINPKHMKIAILIALFVGGGVSLGAGNTVPGDTLYPVKTSVNEEVRGWFAFSSEARANWHAERAERRLEEARVLASRNELSAEARADLESRFEIHATKAGEKAQELRSRNDAEAAARISSRIQSSAEAYAQALGEFAGETTQAAEMSASLKSKVEAWTAVGGVLEITTSPEDHNGIPPSRAPAGSIEGEIDSETEVNGGTDLEIETGTERVRTEGETGVDVRSESEGSLDVNIGL